MAAGITVVTADEGIRRITNEKMDVGLRLTDSNEVSKRDISF